MNLLKLARHTLKWQAKIFNKTDFKISSRDINKSKQSRRNRQNFFSVFFFSWYTIQLWDQNQWRGKNKKLAIPDDSCSIHIGVENTNLKDDSI